jgi:pilus assembly protein CpaB
MTTRSDHSHRRNLRHWTTGGFVVLAVIFCASYNPLSPRIDPREFGDRRKVVVANQDIPLGEKITAEQLALTPIPNGPVQEGVFRKMDEVVGRVAITPIGVRETITNMKLAPSGGAGLSAVIPEGYRAMTIKVDDVVSVSGIIMPGSFVDIVAIIVPVSEAGATNGPISKIVLQNIKVLASGAKIYSPENQGEPRTMSALTLQVTPEQAEKLVLAANEGKLQVVHKRLI